LYREMSLILIRLLHLRLTIGDLRQDIIQKQRLIVADPFRPVPTP